MQTQGWPRECPFQTTWAHGCQENYPIKIHHACSKHREKGRARLHKKVGYENPFLLFLDAYMNAKVHWTLDLYGAETFQHDVGPRLCQ